MCNLVLSTANAELSGQIGEATARLDYAMSHPNATKEQIDRAGAVGYAIYFSADFAMSMSMTIACGIPGAVHSVMLFQEAMVTVRSVRLIAETTAFSEAARAEIIAAAAAQASKETAAVLAAVTRLKPWEIDTLLRMRQLGYSVRESVHQGEEYIDEAGVTYDQMGDPKASQYWNEKEFEESIQDHLRKSNDYTVIDMTPFTTEQKVAIRNYVNTLPPSQFNKIIPIGF